MIDVLRFWNGMPLMSPFAHPVHRFLTINKSKFTSLGGKHIFYTKQLSIHSAANTTYRQFLYRRSNPKFKSSAISLTVVAIKHGYPFFAFI